ncbi:MAG: metallopeptidase family protein [Armatimonadota bacterium]|nr:metallopeptidase family protein [Armatimonadota bacterium]MDR7401963.1 metallopeptidase family protein [Armatimonadota bacterium]MDR7403656.1 metallopeptidase family protein [Armatimonadota bacterium]MDR7437265.1 metallopeptidase family protein [Armatimonadota bacterium]MDR7471486.1 metallopeptidase family protein [Armatimonadota bacterium]
MRLSRRRFRRLVLQALQSLPEEIRARLDNVAVVVEDWPSAEQLAAAGVGPEDTLFGLYEGVPLISRGITADSLLPDKITIFQGPLEEACASEEEMAEEIRRTVVHEIAHHLGIDDERLAELGYD